MDKIKSFRGITKTALISNVMFIVFIVVTLIYYANFVRTQKIYPVVEAVAYAIEVSGFILMIAAAIGYTVRLRFRTPLKVCMILYFLVEFSIMILDFNIISIEDFYQPDSKILIIGHCIFSAFICMMYMQLDKNNTYLQVAVSVASFIMMLGAFAIVYKVKVYASVLINSFAYVVLYSLILVFNKLQLLEPDCHGDVARVYEDESIFDESKIK